MTVRAKGLPRIDPAAWHYCCGACRQKAYRARKGSAR